MPAPRQQLTQPLNRPSPVLPAKAGSTPVLYSPQGGRCSDAEFQRSTRHARNETIAANVFPGRSIPARRLDRLRLRVRLAVELHIRNARVHKCRNRRITCLAWIEPHLPHHRHMRHSTRPRIQKIGSAASSPPSRAYAMLPLRRCSFYSASYPPTISIRDTPPSPISGPPSQASGRRSCSSSG